MFKCICISSARMDTLLQNASSLFFNSSLSTTPKISRYQVRFSIPPNHKPRTRRRAFTLNMAHTPGDICCLFHCKNWIFGKFQRKETDTVYVLVTLLAVEQHKVIIPNKHGEKLVGILHESGSREIVILCHGFRSSKVSVSNILCFYI